MEFYTDKKFIKVLERACQGFIEVIQDIENHIPGINSARIHEEENGRVLCQSDSQKQSWHSDGRFVYGMNSAKEKALCVGHTDEHTSSKGKKYYRHLREIASRIKRKDFKDKMFLSSDKIISETQIIANNLIFPKTPTRLEVLEQEYYDWAEYNEKGINYFREILKISLTTQGDFTDSEKKIIHNMPKENSFRIEMEKIILSNNAINAGTFTQILKNNSR